MGRLKRKASLTKLEKSPKRKVSSPKQLKSPEKLTMTSRDTSDSTSPSKISVFKIDIVSCNGKSLSKTELGSADLESIWKDSLLRQLHELSGYTSSKTKNFTEIRVQYQLKKPMSLRSISVEAEFTHERSGAQGIELLKCRVVGLSDVRKVEIGERVKVIVIKPNFDVTPEQVIEWLSHFGACHDGHRY